MKRSLVPFLALTLALMGCRTEAPPPAAREASTAEVAAPAEATLPTIPLTIDSANGSHAFTVEVARTADEQRLGLMFRPTLAPDRGMIFLFPAPRPASFWMRNTLIPLDMLFIRADGTIANIAHETVPYSLDGVDSDGPVGAVLEIAGGRAAALGIEAGDRVSWDDSALADAN